MPNFLRCKTRRSAPASFLFIQKNIGIDVVEIISFDGLQKSDFALYQKYKIIPALKQLSEIEFSANIARTAAEKFPVWMQLDTGMNRLGHFRK